MREPPRRVEVAAQGSKRHRHQSRARREHQRHEERDDPVGDEAEVDGDEKRPEKLRERSEAFGHRRGGSVAAKVARWNEWQGRSNFGSAG